MQGRNKTWKMSYDRREQTRKEVFHEDAVEGRPEAIRT